MANLNPEIIKRVALKDSIECVTFSPDGRYLLTLPGSRYKTDVWDTRNWRVSRTLLPTGPEFAPLVAAFSPNGKRLVIGGGNEIEWWDTSAKDVRSWKCIARNRAHVQEVFTLSFSPDSRWLVSGSWDKTLKLWDVGTTRLIKNFGQIGIANGEKQAAFSSDGRLLAVTARGVVHVWDVASWKLLHVWNMPANGRAHCLSFVPGSTSLIVVGSRSRDLPQRGFALMRDVKTFQKGSPEKAPFIFEAQALNLAVSAVGPLAVMLTRDGQIWRIPLDQESKKVTPQVIIQERSSPLGLTSLALSADDRYLSTGIARNQLSVYKL
ncbi:MAG: hypothetical protein IAG10_05740 [Planctomycetaceae bacterium]|nr:hypothetical protein [Planctomycetaceae bacterium]